MGTKLYVGNLNYATTGDTLRQAFGANGREVSSVTVIIDRETGRSRGFAFVEMATAEAAQQAMQELDGQELEGRLLKINEAREREPRSFGAPRPGGPGGPRPGYGGGVGSTGGGAGPSGGYAGRGPGPGDGGAGGGAARPPARNFGAPAPSAEARRKRNEKDREKERGGGDADRGKRGRRRNSGDDGDGW